MSQPITTHNAVKQWSWSYSKLKNFETCPKRHYEIDIAKNYPEPESDQLIYGNAVHQHLANRIGKGIPLPKGFEEYEPWALKMLTGPGKLLVEQKLAIQIDFKPCTYFDKKAWYRGIGDVLRIAGTVALVVDWKTGKIIEDATQLALMAQCVFSHYPDVQAVRSEFVWTKEDATTRMNFKRSEMYTVWQNIFPRVDLLKNAADTMNYPPKPGYLCKRWCAVTACPHNGT